MKMESEIENVVITHFAKLGYASASVIRNVRIGQEQRQRSVVKGQLERATPPQRAFRGWEVVDLL